MFNHAGDFSALIWPNRRAQVMRQRLTSNWLFSRNMAYASGVFLNTVRGALVRAEAELSGKDGQSNNISEALDDLRGLLAPVSVRHFNNRTGFKHIFKKLISNVSKTSHRLA